MQSARWRGKKVALRSLQCSSHSVEPPQQYPPRLNKHAHKHRHIGYTQSDKCIAWLSSESRGERVLYFSAQMLTKWTFLSIPCSTFVLLLKLLKQHGGVTLELFKFGCWGEWSTKGKRVQSLRTTQHCDPHAATAAVSVASPQLPSAVKFARFRSVTSGCQLRWLLSYVLGGPQNADQAMLKGIQLEGWQGFGQQWGGSNGANSGFVLFLRRFHVSLKKVGRSLESVMGGLDCLRGRSGDSSPWECSESHLVVFKGPERTTQVTSSKFNIRTIQFRTNDQI